MKPKLHKAKVISKKEINEDILQINLDVLGKEKFEFEAGQFISIKVAENTFRAYSLCSDTDNTKAISILVTVEHEGMGSTFLKELKKEQEIEFIGPAGKFVLAKKPAKEIIFVASGTGIAPEISMLYELLKINPESKIRLYHGIREENDILLMDFLEECKKELKDFDYYLCFSQAPEETVKKYNGVEGYVTEALEIPNPKETQIYLCGNPYMIEDITKIAKESGVPENNIFHEEFTIIRKTE